MKNFIKKIIIGSLLLGQLGMSNQLIAQENHDNSEKIALLEKKKEQVITEEKDALKKEVAIINERLEKGEISAEEADQLKSDAADKRALNIQNKSAIIDNSIALLERGETDEVGEFGQDQYKLILFDFENDGSIVKLENSAKPKKFDRRTYSNFLLAFGFNNAIIEGKTLNDSPYSIGRSRFFELGWNWSTRLFNNSNAVRLRYGFSFLFNELSPTDNRYFIQEDELTYLDLHYGELCRSKLKIDHLIFPLHFEFGPSKKTERSDYIRYSSKKSFKFGLGGYGGFKLKSRQKLKYQYNGSKSKEKIKKSYNTNNIIYGLSGYIGYGVFSFYSKYDLNTIFKEPNQKENNISFGLRFDL